jgi:hypothetical protein
MASAGTTLKISLAPDVQSMLEFIEAAFGRIHEADLQNDARVTALVSEYEYLFMPGTGCIPFPADFQDGGLVLNPSDKFTAFIAKLRALDNVLFAEDRKRRGWS